VKFFLKNGKQLTKITAKNKVTAFLPDIVYFLVLLQTNMLKLFMQHYFANISQGIGETYFSQSVMLQQ